jgi:hypothetical protein
LQDWGLRNARKTTFYAAVNYYCRQLGIVNYSPSIPVEWTKSHDLNNLADDEDNMDTSFDPEESMSQTLRSQQSQLPPKELHIPASLGFQPPPEKLVPGVRARKSKHGKKAVVRSLGADG